VRSGTRVPRSTTRTAVALVAVGAAVGIGLTVSDSGSAARPAARSAAPAAAGSAFAAVAAPESAASQSAEPAAASRAEAASAASAAASVATSAAATEAARPATTSPRAATAPPTTTLRSCDPVLRRFHTRPAFRAPAACVSGPSTGTDHGYLLTTPEAAGRGQVGPAIFDNYGRLIWYLPRPFRELHDLKVVTYNGQRLLAWYEGGATRRGGDRRHFVLMDDQYREVKRVYPGNGLHADMHEFQVTKRGTALFGTYPTAIDPVTHRRVTDYVVQEVDIATGQVIFQWDALQHVPTAASYYPPPTDGSRWDYFHGNSIRVAPDGNLIIDARATSAVYKVNRTTGKVIWTLGGKRDMFHLVSAHPYWQFCFQHDATQLPNYHILLFDDGSVGPNCPNHPARAEEIALDFPHRKATPVREWSSKDATLDHAGWTARFLGSARSLPDNHVLVGWGTVPHITEFTRTERPVFDLTLSNATYRVVREPWAGVPATPPAVAAHRNNATWTSVWASWNGSTQVKRWQVLAGPSPSRLSPVGHVAGRGWFETRIDVRSQASYVAVRALDSAGHVLATSSAVTPSS
jgi:Arylsulfotransferase (ASST)